MAAVASQPPIRTPSGGTTDMVWQPLADCGNGNPAFYHQFFDDFDQNFSFTTGNTYTITTVNAGTFTTVSEDGGAGLFTTGATSTNFEEIQVVTPSFTINSQPKKVFFETRIEPESAPGTMTIIVGLSSTNTTPFTAITDGVYFKWVGGTTTLTINSSISSVVTSATIPAAA